MLNILKFKLKNTHKSLAIYTKNHIEWPNKFVPIIRDWKNSIYAYNKNSLSNIISANRLINKLIKGYFNLYNKKFELRIRKNKAIILRVKKKILSKNKILISLGKFKHTNDLIDITIFFYNRQLLSYMYILTKKYIKILKNKNYLERKLYLIKIRGLRFISRERVIKTLLINSLNVSKINKLNWIAYKRYIRKSLSKEYFSLYYTLLIFINKSKFNNYYLYHLTNLVQKIYKKKIKFNFINLKYHYLNSDLFTQALMLKLNTVKRRLLRSLRRSISKARILEEDNKIILSDSKYLKASVLDNIKYKKLSGVRLEVAGRLTRRFTASRSLYKYKYKGNLININSSINTESASLIRGNFKPNVEYTQLHSKTRIGGYGIKGWISGR